MSWDGRCKHGVYIHPRPAHEVCEICKLERDTRVATRKVAVAHCFNNYIETGDRADLEKGVSELYEIVFKRGTMDS